MRIKIIGKQDKKSVFSLCIFGQKSPRYLSAKLHPVLGKGWSLGKVREPLIKIVGNLKLGIVEEQSIKIKVFLDNLQCR